MPAFGFTNLAMLGWLAAAAAPLLIHLWSRRKYRETPWAAVTFLLAAMRRSARRIQLQQWVLLAVRTLIIVLVVLAVAEPYGEGLLAGGPAGGPVHRVLVIDASYSMAYREGDTRRFDRAKQLAAQLVRDSAAADSFTVIQMADPPLVIVRQDVVERPAIIAQIESVDLAHTGADLFSTLAFVNDAVTRPQGTSEKRLARRPQQVVHIFTDLQRATWRLQEQEPPAVAHDADVEIDAAHKLITAISGKAAITVLPVGSGNAENLAVTHLAVVEPLATTTSASFIEATLHQFGREEKTNVPVELLVDGIPVAEQRVDLPAGGDAAVRFTQHFREPGYHTLAVRTTGDRLEIDNTRWLALPVRDEVKVLCVAGEPGAAKYVARAIDPDPTDQSPLRPVVISEGDLAGTELDEFDSVVLCNVGQLTPGEGQRLARFVDRGGGLIVFLGDRVQPNTYNALAETVAQEDRTVAEPLLPARIGELVTAPQFGVDPLEYRHPIVAAFRGRERAGLLTTPIGRYYQLRIPQGRAEAGLAAALAGGDPFIIAAPYGNGRIIMVATDGSLTSTDEATAEPWTAWPTWPSFLPMVREMLYYATGGRREAWQQPVGSAIGPTRADTPHASVINIARPDGRIDAIAATSDGWSYEATDVGGIYTARASDGGEPRPFAVNVDPGEGDLARADVELFPPELALGPDAATASASAVDPFVSRSGWQGTLLSWALVLLLFESLLAWQFGRGPA
jgi:hypothetical protein